MAQASTKITGDGTKNDFTIPLNSMTALGVVVVQVWQVEGQRKTLATPDLTIERNVLHVQFTTPPDAGQEYEVVIR